MFRRDAQEDSNVPESTLFLLNPHAGLLDKSVYLKILFLNQNIIMLKIIDKKLFTIHNFTLKKIVYLNLHVCPGLNLIIHAFSSLKIH